jgi:hypothetical protein
MKSISLLLRAVLALLALVLTLSAEESTLTRERLDAACKDALAAIEKQRGEPIANPPPFKLASRKDLAKAVALENLPIVRLRQPDEAAANREADAFGTGFALLAIAKYCWSTKELLVVRPNWELQIKSFPELRLGEDDALRAIMVHELCHALDDQAHDFTKLLQKGDSVDAVSALNAVIEGSAQHQARRICTAAGWKNGFERFTAAIARLPEPEEDLGEAYKLILNANAQQLGFAYHQGEPFVAAVEKAGGAEALKRIFTHPPRDSEEILQPKWYLDPKSRPAQLYDLEPALELFLTGFDPKEWKSTRMTLNGQQLAAGLAMLEPADRDRIQRGLRGARFVQLTPIKDPTSKIAVLVVMEFASDDAAQHFLDQAAKLSKLKDETMTKGVIRIVESKSSPIELPNGKGWIHEKRMINGTLNFPVSSVDVRRGRILVETVFSGEPPPRELHEEMVNKLLMQPKRKQP